MLWPWSTGDQEKKRAEPPSPTSRPTPPGSWESVLSTNYTWQQNAVISGISIAAFIGAARVYKRFLRRIPTVNYLNPDTFRGRTLYGYVTRVGDGDNFHLFHAPGGRLMGWNWLPGRRISSLTGKELQGNTVHVRIAGVDAPEMAHFGRPAQPYGQEALDWLKGYLGGRWVRAIPHSRDRFDRVVCSVKRRRFFFFRSDVGLAMIRHGVATVYEAKTGSEFGGMEEQYRAAEAKAKSKGLGMWNQKGLMGRLFGSQDAVETPRQFKTRQRQEEEKDTGKIEGVAGAAASVASGVTRTVVAKAASIMKSTEPNTTTRTTRNIATKSTEPRKSGRTR